MARVSHVTDHVRKAFDLNTSRHIAFWAAKTVSDLKADAIAACGHSGLVIAGAVGMLAHVPVFAVRKEDEIDSVVACDRLEVNGIAQDGPAKRWVWLDDIIASGGTFARSTRRLMDAGLVASPVPVGCILYQRSRNNVLDEDTCKKLVSENPGLPWMAYRRVPTFGYGVSHASN